MSNIEVLVQQNVSERSSSTVHVLSVNPAVAASIYFREFYFLAGYVAAIALIIAMFGFVGLVNLMMFTPLFWLMTKLKGHKLKSQKPDG
jgi:hypothetical protein